ncbi:hypothetical protein MASR1M12_17080 [Erysipelotrichia bacterium]
MANKKANRKLSRILISSVFFIFLLLAASPGWADITNASVFISSDQNGDGVAGIGDTITISCRSNTTSTTGEFPFVTAEPMIGNLPLPQLAGSLYSAILTVSPGSVDGNITFTFGDGSNSSPQRIIAVDNRRSTSQYGPTANSGTGNGGVFKLNDPLQIDLLLNSAADGDSVSANLTALGLSANTIFQANGANAFRLNLTTIPTGKEGTLQTIAVTALDNAGNAATWNTVSVSYDTIAPIIKSVIITNPTANKTYITAGDAIRIQATVSNFDNDTLVASNTSLFGNNPLPLEPVAGGVIGGDKVYETIVYITEADLIQNSFIFFEITATDDAGNSVRRTSNSLRIDSVPPEFQNDVVVKIIRNNSDITNPNRTAIINDTLQITGNVAAGMKDIILTVDLSAVGGLHNQAISFVDGSSAPNLTTTAFKLDYPISQYTSENSTLREFILTAKDIAGNIITRMVVPAIFVDNLPPTISGGLVQNVSRPGQPARYGDQIAITATVGNIDNGSVWVDLRRLGGDASSTLSISGTSYRVDHVVTDSLIGGITDQSLNFVVYAVDDSGNTVQTVTNSLSVDNEPPLFLTATYTVNPVLSASHPYVKVGDRLTFRSQLASSTSSIYDGQTVKIYLNELGQANPVEMAYVGGFYSTSLDVPAGALNYEHYFSLVATDNAGNEKNAVVQVKIDNSVPDVGPMGVNFLTDLAKTGAINVGDRLEFIIPVNDKDDGYCVLDLSMIGGSATTILSNYDPTLRRYYHVHDCASAPVENPGYVFRAIVYDKAFNMMNSLSSTFEVDCRLPIITSFSTTVQELKGKPGVINTGDKIKFTAFVDISSLDGAIPSVNLTTLGGASNQQLYDDGAHGDGGANDGEFSYTHTVLEGATNGENVTFVLTVTDNAGNRVTMSAPTSYLVDNQSLVITSVTNIQKLDTNGNTIVDLDGKYTDEASFATDTVTLKVLINGANNGLPASVTVDLTKFGYSETASAVPCIITPSGFEAEAVIEPRRGNTNNEEVKLVVKVTDENGNETVGQAANAVRVDNMPPTIDIYPVTFVVDNGRIGEANRGDVIQIKVKMTNHDGILPMIDFTNLYSNNGLTPPNPILFPPNAYGGNEYTYQWTVPEGLGTKEGLTIIALDASGNMTYKRTAEIRFLSKTPRISAFPYSRLTLFENTELINNIANPGERLVVTCAIDSLYSANNAPPATVLVDIRSITNKPGDDDPGFEDGDANTYWVALTASTTTTPFIYNGDFTIAASDKGIDASNFSLTAKVLHPDTNAITMATAQITSDPDSPIGIDTRVPRLKPGTIPTLTIVETNFDNTSSFTANIGDIMRVQANIDRLTDPGSVTAILYYDFTVSTRLEVYRVPMSQIPGSDLWEGTFVVATGTRPGTEELGPQEWRIVNGSAIKFQVYMSDDADNLATSSLITPSPGISIDNHPPQIDKTTTFPRVFAQWNQAESWVANVGDGVASDTIGARVLMTIGSADSTNRAYIDLSPIGATSTYALQLSGEQFQTNAGLAYPALYAPFPLLEGTYDLATATFRIYVVDKAGNRDYVEDIYNQLAIDSRRPEVSYASYDGRVLNIGFSEQVRPATFDISTVRIGYKPDHTGVQLNQKAARQLDPLNDLLFTNVDSNIMSIQLSPQTKSVIADWGKRTLYISVATDDNQNPTDAYPIALDIAGNWLRQVSRNITLTTIGVTDDYTIRPKLVGGRYVANLTAAERSSLYITFDKDVDPTTLTADSLKQLAIWYNKGSNNESWANAYRFNTQAVDTFDPVDPANQSRTLRIQLSEEAQNWIALKYGRLASQFHLQVNGTDLEPPPYPASSPTLIRDFEGNSVMPILPVNAVTANLTPLNTPFQISSNSTLDLSSSTPILTIHMQNNRKARLFDDPYSESTLALSRTMPADLSRVYIYEKSDTNTGRSISLGSSSNVNPMVKWSGTSNYTELNVYASTTVRIPLTAEAVKTILSWGTSEFYLACSNSAFKDLWGNSSEVYPGTSGTAARLTTIKPTSYGDARIHTVAITPVKADSALFKGQVPDGFIYEVSFDTATLSADVRVPIARNIQPTLELYKQGTDERLDTGRFVRWVDHNQGGVVRTAIQFANTGLPPSGNHQRVPVYVKVAGFADIFYDKPTPLEGTASSAFDLSKKVDSSAYQYGFNQTASYPMIFDNASPFATVASSPTTIGVIGAGNLRVQVTFNEAMDQTNTSAARPTLRLIQGSSTVMGFSWGGWISSTTAEFINSNSFDASTAQGECYYAVNGGYDEAGNMGSDITLPTKINIHSKGPNIKAFKVQTFQATTAKAIYDFLTDAPFSPLVAPNIATITIEFDTLPRDATGSMHIYAVNATTPIATLTARPSSTNSTIWQASWDGRNAAGEIADGRHEIRFYDLSNNEGSRRGTITVDSQTVQVKNWDFPNLKTNAGKAYYSPLVQSSAKMNAVSQISGSMKMRLVKPGNSTDTYPMTTFASGYTINFDGKSSDAVSVPLDGEFEVSLVDFAGNVGIALPGGKATATLVIDRIGPEIKRIEMNRASADTNGNITDDSALTTRFNPRSDFNRLRFKVYETFNLPRMESGAGIIRIMSGSTMLKELILTKVNPDDPMTVVWDGTNTDGQILTDGKYTVIVTDLAGNPAKQPAETIDFVSSSFKLTAASQSSPDSLKLVFNQGVASNTTLNPSPFEVINTENNSVVTLAGIAINSAANNVITASFATALTHDKTYRVTVKNPASFFSEDFAAMKEGDNIATFKADIQGPKILATNGITYDGITTQNKFNVVFDEQLEAISAATKANYAITGTSTLITDVALRADLKSVTITTDRNIVEGTPYRITIKGVKDLIGNKSDTFADFEGRDVTPPQLTVTAFSNPANEFDLVVIVKANEPISGQPTATITQSGGTAVSLLLNSGTDPAMFIGGTTLNRNYPGLATIKVTAKDTIGNTGSANISFTTAFVNASMRAAVKSGDGNVEAVFEPGTLNKDTLVLIIPEELSKTGNASFRGSQIMPSALAGMTQTQLKSIKASIVASDRAAEELEPVGQAYSLVIPAGRLQGSVAMSMKAEPQSLNGAALYHNDGSGWKKVNYKPENSNISFSATAAGTFALMRDIKAPRASLLNDITSAPVRESRPVFTWSIEEFASGIAPETAMAVLDGRKYPVMLDETATVARFAAIDDLISGEHSISLQIADKAGNLNVLPALRFVAQPALKIHEVVQFPNPARNRVSLRISTNRNEVDAEEIRVKIYDTAGHLVAATNDLTMRQGNNGAGKVVQDVLWDLRNKDGKAVANGVYFARIEVRDPDNYEKKTRYTHKIAVLR